MAVFIMLVVPQKILGFMTIPAAGGLAGTQGSGVVIQPPPAMQANPADTNPGEQFTPPKTQLKLLRVQTKVLAGIFPGFGG
jgi:hypothetical protein